MLKEIFSQRLNTQSKTVNNAIITLGDIDDSGKGRKFKSRFLTPGIAGYPGQFGNVLIKKESFDKFIKTLEGAPVIINHKNLTEDNADTARVGVVSNVWFNDKDGWYWCDGIIWDKTAQNLITDKGWSVSCSYDVKLADDAGGSENNIPYNIEFLDGVFTHLAIVNNPRYERANIVFNSKTELVNVSKVNNEKEQNEMTLVEELKKLILKVENANEDEMDKDKDKEKEKIENEKVDKRDIIRQIMAIAGKREDDEDVRTIAKLAEKLAYDKSEAGTADNKKVKNSETKEDEEKYEDLKKDVKKDVVNKCKNSVDNSKTSYFDELNKVSNQAIKPKNENSYVSRTQKLKDADEYFKR